MGWGLHLKIRRQAANTILHKLRLLLKSKLNLKTKLLIYKTIIRPILSYGIQIWGPAKPSNIRLLQSHHNIILRLITGAPWRHFTNDSFHKDLNCHILATIYYKRFHSKLNYYINTFIKNISSHTLPDNPERRLKRNWSHDLL